MMVPVNNPGHRSKALYVIIGATLLALVIGCSSGDDNEESATFACDGSIHAVQDLVSRIVQDVPGFAGCEPDPGNPNGYIINVTSPDVDVEAARAAILSQEQSQALEDADLRALQVDVSRAQEWYEEAKNEVLTALPEESRLSGRWHSADFDEVHNQGLIWYASEEWRAWAQSFILDVNAPPGVIVAILAPEPEED